MGKKDDYAECYVVFNFMKELEKSIMVRKKTKKINKVFFVPKSLIRKQDTYMQKKNLWKDVSYERKRIGMFLPLWYCRKELGFYR